MTGRGSGGVQVVAEWLRSVEVMSEGCGGDGRKQQELGKLRLRPKLRRAEAGATTMGRGGSRAERREGEVGSIYRGSGCSEKVGGGRSARDSINCSHGKLLATVEGRKIS